MYLKKEKNRAALPFWKNPRLEQDLMAICVPACINFNLEPKSERVREKQVPDEKISEFIRVREKRDVKKRQTHLLKKTKKTR